MPLDKVQVPDRGGWATFMDSLGALLDRYEELSEDDVGYWHGEESLTASLVAAAWQGGGLGLAEFETKRVRRIREQSGKGSGDAYLRIGEDWYTVEAKLCWDLDEIETSLEAARGNLRTLDVSSRAGSPIALCYSVPMVPDQSPAHLIASKARDLLRQIPELDLLVAYTPLKQPPEQDGYTYPGMIALGRVRQWEKQS